MTAGSREKKGCITCTPLPNWWYISRHCTSLPCGILFTANSVLTVEDVYRLVEQRSLWSYRKILLRKSSRCSSAFCSAPSRYAQTSTATVARSPAQSGTPRTWYKIHCSARSPSSAKFLCGSIPPRRTCFVSPATCGSITSGGRRR